MIEQLIKDRVDPDELIDVLELDVDTLVDLLYPIVTEAIDHGKFDYLIGEE